MNLEFNPILVHELRGVLRTRRFALTFISSLFVLVVATLLFMNSQPEIMANTPAFNLGWRTFLMLTLVQAYVILIIFPAFSCGAIGGERDRNTYDLLLSTTLTPRRIVSGKLQASCSYLLLYLAATLPVAGITALYTGVRLSEILVGYLLLALFGILLNLIAIYFSATCTYTNRAIALTYLLVILLAIFFAGLVEVVFSRPQIIRATLRTELGPGTRLYSYMFLGMIGYVALSSLCYLSTLNRLRPASANKSSPLRVFHLMVVIALPVVLMNLHMLHQPSSATMRLRVGCLTMALAAGYALSLILCFSTEDRLPHPRIRERIRNLPPTLKAFRSWLYPGGYTGPVYSLVMMVLLLSVVHLFTATEYGFLSMKPPDGWESPATAWPAFTMGLAVYLLAIASMGHFLASFPIDRRLRIGIILLFMLTTTLAPHLLQAIGMTTNWLRPLSPMLTSSADWTSNPNPALPAGRVLLWELSPGSYLKISDVGRLFYILLTAVLCTLAPLKFWSTLVKKSEQ